MKPSPSLLVLALIVAPLLFPPTLAGGGEPVWNQWRGPSRDGTVPGPSWPADLTGLQPLWRIDLGKSYSGPIVGDDRVFVAEAVDGDREGVRALDRATGAELWRATWQGRGEVPFFARANGDWIRSTPAYDGTALYVGGMEEVLRALDAATGQELWKVDFPERFGTRVPEFGFASSPLVEGDSLYVQAANSVVKLDKRSGQTLWRALESDGDIMESGAFSSPVFASLAGVRQLVVQTRTTLAGLDPESGRLLWSRQVPNFRGMNILTPATWGDSILTSSYRNRTFLYTVDRAGHALEARETWTHKSHGYMSSPVVVDGHAYLHLGSGRFICLDLGTGEERWVSPPLGKYASLVAQADKILALDEGGELRLLAADPRAFQVLDSRTVARQPTWAHLAVAGDLLAVRELEGLTLYRWSGIGSVPVAQAPSGRQKTRSAR